MLNIEGYDFELPQIGTTPTMGREYEGIIKQTISGKIIRIDQGKRFNATFTYAFLLDEQIARLQALLDLQRTQGYLNVEISAPGDAYSGKAIVTLGDEQTRFTYNKATQSYVWVNWSLTVQAVDYDS